MTTSRRIGRWPGPRTLLRRVVARPSVYRHVVLRTGPAVSALEPVLRRLSRQRFGVLDLVGLEQVQITAPGRRTAMPRTVTLQCIPDGHALLVIDSNWGRHSRPAWSANLAAATTVDVRHRRRRWRASVTQSVGPTHIADWQRICTAWPSYALAQRAAGRPFRIFRLDPIPPQDARITSRV